MMRVHNSHRPIPGLVSLPHPRNSRKPAGLWWSDGSAWRDLLTADERTGALRNSRRRPGKYDYEVVLGDRFRLLTISTPEDALLLSRDFAQPAIGSANGFWWQTGDLTRYDPDQDDSIRNSGHARAFTIDWSGVAALWDGIEIRMPVGKHRGDRVMIEWLDLDWDIPSGCAWRTTDVRISRLVSEPVIISDPEECAPSP